MRTQTRLFLNAYIQAGTDISLPVEALNGLRATLPTVDALPSEQYKTSAPSVRKLRVGGRRQSSVKLSHCAKGARVIIHGLQGAKQHNGKSGVVEQQTEAGRYVIQLEDGAKVAVKPSNLAISDT